MEHETLPTSENDHLTLRFSSDHDVSNHVSASERATDEDYAISDISESPSSGRYQTARQLPPNESTNKVPNLTTTAVAPKPATRRRHAHLLRNWWLEIGACFLFVLALVAIVITLRPHQGKPLPQWPYNISINSLISVYVVVLKVTVLLVIAERIGQLKWRWFETKEPSRIWPHTMQQAVGHWVHSHFFGLWVCDILCLPQIIRYQGCSVTIKGPQANSSIPRTNYFAAAGGHVGAGQVSIGPDLQSTINAGIFSPGTLVNPVCSTGNCSFPNQYDTLGYCGGCTDITNNLAFDEEKYSPDNERYVASRNNTVSYLPSGLSINSTNPDVRQAGISHGGSSRPRGYNLVTMGSTLFTEDETSVGESSQVAEFILARRPEQSSRILSEDFNKTCQNGNNSLYCLGFGTARCTLNPCIRTYTGNVASGVFQERLVLQNNDTSIWASAMINDTAGYNMATVDTKCISPTERNSLIAAGYRIDPAKRWLAYNLTFDPAIKSDSSFPSSMLRRNCIYVVDTFTAGSLWSQYLATFFNGTVSGTSNQYGVIDMYQGPQNLQTMYDFGNITLERVDSIFRNISDSLTTFIRQTGNENHSTPVSGIVWHDDTCLEVRWGWLAFPAVLVLLTVVFFTITIILTTPIGNRFEVWKSSPLALIFHGLEAPNLVKRNASLQGIKDMDRAAEGIIVRLAPSANGMNLVTGGGKESNGG